MSGALEVRFPDAAPAAPRNVVVSATVAVAAAGSMLVFGMLGTWFRFRDAAPLRESSSGKMIRDWLPADIPVPEVATNTMAITMVVICVIAQWAAYSAKRDDSRHATMALALTAFLGLAAVNAQVAIWVQMGLVLMDGAYQTMFYAVTGTVLALIVSGVAFSLVAMFRAAAGRLGDRDVFTAHALYWYFLATVFIALWFVVYVQK